MGSLNPLLGKYRNLCIVLIKNSGIPAPPIVEKMYSTFFLIEAFQLLRHPKTFFFCTEPNLH